MTWVILSLILLVLVVIGYFIIKNQYFKIFKIIIPLLVLTLFSRLSDFQIKLLIIFKKILIQLFIIFVSVVLIVNVVGFYLSSTGNSYAVIGVGDTTYIFAHGSYKYLDDINGTAHVTFLDNGKHYLTKDILDAFNNTKVWISMCQQSNFDYMIKNNTEKIYWYDNVDRVKKAGNVYPYFTGFGINRQVVSDDFPMIVHVS